MSYQLRKIRSDKKRDVKPTISITLYEVIHQLSYITNLPMKDIAETICIFGLNSIEVIESFEGKFKRNYRFNENTIFIGNPDLQQNRIYRKKGQTKRLTIRFTQQIHDQIAMLSFSLDMTVSSTTALLLQASIFNTNILNEFLKRYIHHSLNSHRKKQLMAVLNYLHQQDPDPENKINLFELFTALYDLVFEKGKNTKEQLEKWLDKVTSS